MVKYQVEGIGQNSYLVEADFIEILDSIAYFYDERNNLKMVIKDWKSFSRISEHNSRSSDEFYENMDRKDWEK